MDNIYTYISNISKCLHLHPQNAQDTPMGWLWLVASIKLQVSFAKEPYKTRRYSAKETYHLIDPTDRSHAVCHLICCSIYMH